MTGVILALLSHPFANHPTNEDPVHGDPGVGAPEWAIRFYLPTEAAAEK
jgi:hypothetical protein